MKPKSFKVLFPELSEGQIEMLKNMVLECVGDNEQREDTFRLQPTTAVFERNRLKDEIRTNLMQLFREE